MKKCIYILLILSLTLVLTGCSKGEENINKEKIIQEIAYIDKKIISMLNELNNISLENYKIERTQKSLTEEKLSGGEPGEENKNEGNKNNNQNASGGQQSQDNNIDITELSNSDILDTSSSDIEWDKIKKDVELTNTAWNTILIDLYSKNIAGDMLQKFSTDLNNAIITIKNEDKLGSIITLSNLYQNLPTILNDVIDDKMLASVKRTKYFIISSYSYANQNDWEKVSLELQNAENEFLNVMNNIEYTKNKENKIYSIYINIKEMQNGLNKEDFNLFILSYKNTIKELNKL